MPGMSESYKNAVAARGAEIVTYIGLVNQNGSELSGGTPAYSRRPVSWGPPSGGVIRSLGNLIFDVPAGTTVAGWRGFSALSGGVSYGCKSVEEEVFDTQSQCVLAKGSLAVRHESPL